MHLIDAIELHLPRGYTIREELGTGATSLVYRACRAETGECLVVKVMLPGSVTSDAADRFMREMQLLKRLAHPRIVPILQPGEANGALFFTMPYIDGATLRARLDAAGRLAVRDALLITRDITDALGYAHARGVVHRDVKPGNILLAGDGAAYLIDFGLADSTLAAPAQAAREARYIVGTPGYMSPEKLAGRRAEDWRGDFFSLGCVLYEMLAGTAPFPAGALPGARPGAPPGRFPEPVPDVRTARRDAPDDVAAIVRRCLDADPTARFATAAALRGALDAALQRLDRA